jgi:UDP-N-acetylmuramate: L-alanyl-gamma-D-glutamyl-meso-diaminopimelate ligase
VTLKVYFLGIAGAGMSAPVTDYLDRLGVAWRDGFDAALVSPNLDGAVIGGSAKLDLAHNPELAELKRRGVPMYSFPEFLGRHTQGRRNAVIAGSFGKSTLTALCAVLMREAGRDPGYFIGAVPLDLPTTGDGGADPVFLIEGDEYITGDDDRRSKFAFYHPGALLLSSLVHDHVNVFPTMADYEAPFAELIAGLPVDALLVCAYAFEPLHRLTSGRTVVWYGLDPCPGYHADRVEIGEVTTFDLVTPGGERIALKTELLGLHNIENIVGAAAFLLERGEIDAGALQRGVARFRGVARRLDKKTTTSRVPVYEGFGSSYEKARSGIEAILLHFPGRPAVVVFEPHTFSWRNQAALNWYDTVFEGVARVLLLPPPTHGAHDQLAASEILERIESTGVEVTLVGGAGETIANLEATLTGNEVVLLLSSGPLDGLPASLSAVLDRLFG